MAWESASYQGVRDSAADLEAMEATSATEALEEVGMVVDMVATEEAMEATGGMEEVWEVIVGSGNTTHRKRRNDVHRTNELCIKSPL